MGSGYAAQERYSSYPQVCSAALFNNSCGRAFDGVCDEASGLCGPHTDCDDCTREAEQSARWD